MKFFQAAVRRRWSAAASRTIGLTAALLSGLPLAMAESPYAVELVSENGAFGGAALYNDPASVLGEPTRIAINNDPLLGNSPFHVKIVEPAYNREYLTNEKVITTLGRRAEGSGFVYGSITVKFDHPVVDHPANPYGIDLNVFGNAYYLAAGFSNDAIDMRSHQLIGGIFAEPVVVSVSPDNVNWYTYDEGPFGDTAFPTQGHEWSAEQHDATGNGWTDTTTDFTKPVNPALNSVLGGVGQSMRAVDAMATYVGAGGGTGFDLAESGFEWIQYVRVQSTAQMRDGEIDAFADVRPTRIGEALSVTPENVAAGTPLYYQSTANESHTAIVADFAAISDLARLSTAAISDIGVIAALPDGELLASFQLDVLALIGTSEIDFSVNYQLSPGEEYDGGGDDLELLQWDGSSWQSLDFSFDLLTDRLALIDWSEPSATLAIMRIGTGGLAGDFNRDGQVDTADYVVWRRGLGSTYSELHYNAWRTNFGATLGDSSASRIPPGSIVAPEPRTFVATLLTAFCALICRSCRVRRMA